MIDKIDINNLSRDELEDVLVGMGEGAYRARQIFRWLYGTRTSSFDEMTNLSHDFRKTLKEKFRITHLTALDSKISLLDGTAKYLFKLEDGNSIETVFLPEPKRVTICLSSQVGCKFSCDFCASAPFGYVRNLTTSEILNEVLSIKDKNPGSNITNLVFMGIGEPLDNYDNVMKAIRIFNDKDAFNIGARKITISSCGIIPGIERLKKEGLQIELSISLHSADDSTRSRLVGVNKKYHLKDLIGACRDYINQTNRIITFEYVLIKDVNSSRDDAIKLIRILKDIKCKVNVLAYNRVIAKNYSPPAVKDVIIFTGILKNGGINAVVRKPKGYDIDAACGQLRISKL